MRVDGTILTTEKGREEVRGGRQVVISVYLVRGVDDRCSVCNELRVDGVL